MKRCKKRIGIQKYKTRSQNDALSIVNVNTTIQHAPVNDNDAEAENVDWNKMKSFWNQHAIELKNKDDLFILFYNHSISCRTID
jgi:hypothetical protein